MRDHLLIYVNGQRHEVRGERVFQSLADFIRCDLRLTGTKVVCAEGDCGSCSAFVGTMGGGGGGGQIEYRPVTSCIQFLYQLDCAHVVTVEGLLYGGQLNPVQEAMVNCHGAQCGYCTPGFIVSMCSTFEPNAGTRDVGAACVGNLCRCTGYEPILRAGAAIDAARMRPLNALYPPEPILDDLRQHASDEVLVRADGRTWFQPRTVGSAVRFRADHPACTVFSGGTDLGVLINKGLRDPRELMTLAGLEELRTIQRDGDALAIGAAASVSQLERACADALPEYGRFLYWFGSPPIRNAATVGGNIANGSPIGDSMPAMYVLNAEVELTGLNGSRRVNINDFYTGYRKTVAAPDELITRIFLPLPGDGEIFKLYKVSKRKDLDISAFTAALWMRTANSAQQRAPAYHGFSTRAGARTTVPAARTIAEARIAFGGVGPNIVRLRQAEAFLSDQPLTLDTLRRAGELARGEVQPISDVRGSRDYRWQLAENIFGRFWFDIGGPAAAAGGDNGLPAPGGNGDGELAQGVR